MSKEFVLSILISILNRAPISAAEQDVLNRILEYISDLLDGEEADAEAE